MYIRFLFDQNFLILSTKFIRGLDSLPRSPNLSLALRMLGTTGKMRDIVELPHINFFYTHHIMRAWLVVPVILNVCWRNIDPKIG
ncbi:hypothetical protein HZS_7720 [Henneguya salminicola]|nr:hypothetical protein HZS_7720 [Henneguya salminicola]